MLKKAVRTVLAAAAVVCGAAASAYAHPGHTSSHHGHAAHGAHHAAAHRRVSGHVARQGAVVVAEAELVREASPSRGLKSKTVAVPKLSMRAVAALQEEIDLEDEEGSTCLRAQCNCTSTSHGNPRCYRNRGDCPNHEGLLCIWNQ